MIICLLLPSYKRSRYDNIKNCEANKRQTIKKPWPSKMIFLFTGLMYTNALNPHTYMHIHTHTYMYMCSQCWCIFIHVHTCTCLCLCSNPLCVHCRESEYIKATFLPGKMLRNSRGFYCFFRHRPGFGCNPPKSNCTRQKYLKIIFAPNGYICNAGDLIM